MKKLVFVTVLTINLLFSSGIPVVDVVSNTQALQQNLKTLAEYAEQARRWEQEILHYQNQINAYQNQLLSQTAIRDSVAFTKDVQSFYNFSSQYGHDFLSLESDISNPTSQLGQKAKELFDKHQVFDSCENSYYSQTEKDICKNKMVRRVQEVAVYQEYSTNLLEMSTTLSNLGQKVANAQDIKESQDLSNAIQLQLAQIDLTKTQVELMNAQNIRLDMIEKQKKEQLFKQSLSKPMSDFDYSSF